MNSGMDTVSISTKSALPNSRLSCSAMAPADGLRWARTGSGGRTQPGPARGALGCKEGGAARLSEGLDRTEAAPLLLGALSAGATHPAVSASPAEAARRCGGRDTETATAAAGPASGLGLAPAPRPPAPPGPSLSGSAPARPTPPAKKPAPAWAQATASSPGRRARAGRWRRRGRAPGRAGPWRRGCSAPPGGGLWDLRGGRCQVRTLGLKGMNFQS